jgi:hypothetical protein
MDVSARRPELIRLERTQVDPAAGRVGHACDPVAVHLSDPPQRYSNPVRIIIDELRLEKVQIGDRNRSSSEPLR